MANKKAAAEKKRLAAIEGLKEIRKNYESPKNVSMLETIDQRLAELQQRWIIVKSETKQPVWINKSIMTFDTCSDAMDAAENVNDLTEVWDLMYYIEKFDANILLALYK